MKAYRWTASFLTGLVLICAAGCNPGSTATVQAVTPSPSRVGSFTPYRTITPSLTATHPTTTPPTSTPLPTITPTPRTYVVKAGDDMTGIALRYRVPLADLKTANPTVNPRLMKIGTVLIIPGTGPALTGEASANRHTAADQYSQCGLHRRPVRRRLVLRRRSQSIQCASDQCHLTTAPGRCGR